VLFHDKRLSITNTVACASCHQQSHGFAGSERFNTGVLGIALTRQAMPLANVRYNLHSAWFSDMRATSLQTVARTALESPLEMGMPEGLMVEKLRATSFYGPMFEAAFGTPGIYDYRVLRALEQYLRSLVSYRTKFDRAFNSLDNNPVDPTLVLTEQEMRGSVIFRGSNGVICQMCHDFQGTVNIWQANNGLDLVPTDPGTTDASLARGGIGVFRAPSLHNLAYTAPYMHDGRFATLRDVINHYDHGINNSPHLDVLLTDSGQPIRMNLSEEDKDALEAFLLTLSDDAMIADPKFSDPFQ
jgi:cytochrome c peroxidase